ncbi:MAG: UDP-N-acetylglucosamine 2-epimerase [Lachnospiraceae bacterium]
MKNQIDKRKIIFFVGTEAELIKLFPIMLELKKNGIEFCIIASGQNDITKSSLMKVIGEEYLELELSQEGQIKKTALGLLSWWFQTYRIAGRIIKTKLGELENSIICVHGDTVSTVMGAAIGKKLHLKVMHIEAGLRSHDFLNPFPEEIDRMITSKFANYHFAPGKTAAENLSRVKGKVIDTECNTIYDSLQYSYKIPYSEENIKLENITASYCVFVLHRQENLGNRELVENIIQELLETSKSIKCIFLLHKITEVYLQKYGLLDKLKNRPNIMLVPRMQYFDFMKILNGAEFVITDGGSNQEELFYMGKPCLIMRKTTERNDGIGENALLQGKDNVLIHNFVETYIKYRQNAKCFKDSPSEIIAKKIIEIYKQ